MLTVGNGAMSTQPPGVTVPIGVFVGPVVLVGLGVGVLVRVRVRVGSGPVGVGVDVKVGGGVPQLCRVKAILVLSGALVLHSNCVKCAPVSSCTPIVALVAPPLNTPRMTSKWLGAA